VPDFFGGVGAWRAHRNSAVFYATEIAAAKMLLFFRKSVALDILTLRGKRAQTGPLQNFSFAATYQESAQQKKSMG
jgi:hypothetical protein